MNRASGGSPLARVFFGLVSIAGAGATLGACAPDSPPPPAPVAVQFPALVDMVYLPGPLGDGLLVDRFEVTDAEFERFVRDTGYGRDRPAGFLSHWHWPSRGLPQPPQRTTPVVHVNLHDAQAYAAYRGKSIPTTREWQSMVPGFEVGLFPWSEDSYAENCNVLATGLGRVTEVGVFEAGLSESGCYDLIGNVWEWATDGGELASIMGGAFTTRVRDEQRQGDERRGVLASSRRRERHPDERSFDVGFRCVIRRADRYLEKCLEEVEAMQGPARMQAIRELLRVGQPSRGENRVLPFVAEREFRTRVIWSAGVPEVGALLRCPVPLGSDDGRDDLLVVSRGLLQGLSGREGRTVLEVALPSDLSIPEVGLLGPQRDAAWFWTENAVGGIRLVELPGGASLDLPAPPEEQISEAIEAHLVGAGRLLFVQSLYQESGSFAEDPERDLVRLQRVDAGVARELLLPGVFESLQLLDGARALLSTRRAIDLAGALPFGRDGIGNQPEGLGNFADLQGHSLFLLDLDAFEVRASRFLSPAPVPDRIVLRPAEFLAPALPGAHSVLVAVGQVLVADQAEAPVERSFELHVLDLETLETVNRQVWTTGEEGRLQASEEPQTLLGLTQDQQPVAFAVVDGTIQRFDLEGAVPEFADDAREGDDPAEATPVRREWWRPSGLDRVGRLLFTSVADELAIQRLEWNRGRPQLRLVDTGPRRLSAQVSRYLRGGPEDSRLGLVLQSGEVLSLDLGGGGFWSAELPPRSGEVQVLALDRAGRDLVLVGPPPAANVWWRDWGTGQERGAFRVRRAPLGKFALARVRGGSQLDWVVSLSDPAIVNPDLDAGDRPTNLVASLGEPDAAAAQLLADFDALLRAGQKGRTAP